MFNDANRKLLLLSRREGGQKNQRGVSLILVLFLLVVVSLLVAAMARLNQGSSNAVSMEIQSARALFAAESGAQIAAMTLFPIDGTPACNNSDPVSFSKTFGTAGLNSCSANITHRCTTAGGRTIFTVVSSGSCGVAGTADYARRQITVGLRSL